MKMGQSYLKFQTLCCSLRDHRQRFFQHRRSLKEFLFFGNLDFLRMIFFVANLPLKRLRFFFNFARSFGFFSIFPFFLLVFLFVF